MSPIEQWLKDLQALSLQPEAIDPAARSAAHIGAMARKAALELPFDTDPAAFSRLFESLSKGRQDD